ncbi:MAG: hypothetical protein JO070_01905 [Verrucomicrobia bacterium]|nr:hypothetical protein [Verrucomicrobiota bacterium]
MNSFAEAIQELQEFRSQEFRSSGVRSQESGVRSQESGVRSQEFRMGDFGARSRGRRSKIIATICKLEIRGSILQLLNSCNS